MMLVERAHNPDGLFGWFNFERRNWLAIVLLAGIGGFSWGNGHTTTSVVEVKDAVIAQKTAQVEHKEMQLSAALSVAGCQQKRAEVAESIAAVGPATADPLPNCPPVSAVAPKGTTIPVPPNSLSGK